MTQNEIFHIGKQALEAQSFSKLLGTNLLEFTTGEVVLEVPSRNTSYSNMALYTVGLLVMQRITR